jgi:xanthine dehydrogenase YagR molybdenum-binding subunit
LIVRGHLLLPIVCQNPQARRARTINPRTVSSQLHSSMIWGVSFALHEQAVIDPRSGGLMNPNLGQYHIPVNATYPRSKRSLSMNTTPHVNALGIKGVGDIGDHTDTAGAVANAVSRDWSPRARIPDHA